MSPTNSAGMQTYQDGRERYVLQPRQLSPERKAYRVREVAEMLGLPKSTVYDLIRRNDLRAVRLGRGPRKVILITAMELSRVLRIPEDPLCSVRR